MEKAIIYKRKSSDSEDRQILSLSSQDKVLKESLASQYEIVGDYEESKSAKAPGRPKFDEMVKRIYAGEAKYIICWAINRLSRNAKDSGEIEWLVSDYGLKVITPEKVWGIEDLMTMKVLMGVSEQFIRDLRKATLRGIMDKVDSGIAPIVAPIGYLNDVTKKQGLRDIIPDPQRFYLVRKMWDLLLTGNYSVAQVLETATNKWGLRLISGKPLTKAYWLFENEFYYGDFRYNGELHPGIHKPMITKREFDKAQDIIHGHINQRGATRHLAYTGGLIKCACGGSCVLEERFRKICTVCHKKYNAELNTSCPICHSAAPAGTWHHQFIRCGRKPKKDCHQPGISVTEFEKQIDKILTDVEIPQEFVDWTLMKLKEKREEETQGQHLVLDNIQHAIVMNDRKLESLAEKYFEPENRTHEVLTADEFKKYKSRLKEEKDELVKQLEADRAKKYDWFDRACEVFNFCANARTLFANSSPKRKRAIVAALGLYPIIDNKIVRIDLLKPIQAVKEVVSGMKVEKDGIVPNEQSVTVSQSQSENTSFPVGVAYGSRTR